jgi:DNA-binding NarL/FixJ family response regulator
MKRASILIVDNNPSFDGGYKFLQHNHSDEVVIVGTATEQRGSFTSKGIAAKSGLVELCMPGVDGESILSLVTDVVPETRIIA